MFEGILAGAQVGQLTDVVGGRSGRVTADLILQARIGHERPKDAFGYGRPADVAITDEENAYHAERDALMGKSA
ncbi:hypothetical protein GCM10027578_30960 [Spirosoma luteolum]